MPELHRTTANGVEFAYYEQGDGPLVLLLHGFPDIAETWLDFLDRLAAAGYRAVAPYLRGYAPTSIPADGRYDPAALGDDLAALIEALSPDGAAYVLSMDWGGTATHSAMERTPQRIKAAAIMNTAHPVTFVESSGDPAFVQKIFHFWFFQLPFTDLTVSIDGLPFVDFLWRSWTPSGTPDPNHIEAVKACLAQPGVMPAALSYYRSLLNTVLENPEATLDPAPIETPTLAIYGEHDATALYAHLEDRVFKGPYERVILPGVGHFPHRERPDEVAAKVIGWFGAHR